MITFRDPPPLEVRVQSLKEPVESPPVFHAPVMAWVVCILLLIAGAIHTAMQRTEVSAHDALVAALTNTLPREAERGIRAVLPINASRQDVQRAMTDVRAPCRQFGDSARNASFGDSALICLGFPIVRANTFTRERIRFVFRNAALTAVEACPTFVHWSRTPVPEALASRVAASRNTGCWRDATNPADNEWSFAILPDSPFTTVTVNGAERVSQTTNATPDTLLVLW